MKINGLQCNQCGKPYHMDPLVVGNYLPKGWFSLRHSSDGPLDKHFCSNDCLKAWTQKDIDEYPLPPQGPAMIAGEDLRRGLVCQGPDGLVYQAKPGEIVEENNS